MDSYFVSKIAQPESGDHYVHIKGCVHTPEPINTKPLGTFSSCAPAVAHARKSYPRSNGCYHCCKDCHTN